MSDSNTTFVIQQDIFRGPIDLLYYLIQQKELDVSEVSLSKITDQYLSFIDILQELDLDNIGVFLQIAATLLHLKARSLFSEQEEDQDEDDIDMAEELIGQLLEYKRFKYAGINLAEYRARRALQYPRGFKEDKATSDDEKTVSLEDVELGTLLSIFMELMAQTMRNIPDKIVYDDISVEDHIAHILERLTNGSITSITFQEFITGTASATPSREFMCGAFIACLELTKQHQVHISQNQAGGDIIIELVSEEERNMIEAEEQELIIRENMKNQNS